MKIDLKALKKAIKKPCNLYLYGLNKKRNEQSFLYKKVEEDKDQENYFLKSFAILKKDLGLSKAQGISYWFKDTDTEEPQELSGYRTGLFSLRDGVYFGDFIELDNRRLVMFAIPNNLSFMLVFEFLDYKRRDSIKISPIINEELNRQLIPQLKK